jgi:precorrin-6Y C5,15-methyltransferase (decarboxylating)
MLAQLEQHRGTPTAILATGDPMWFGIGATLAKHLAPDEFTGHPAPSCFQLAWQVIWRCWEGSPPP